MARRKKDDPRDVNLTVRFSEAEIALLHRRARAAGHVTLAGFVREASFGEVIASITDAAAAAPDPAIRDLTHQVHKVGVNLNQIARRMHEDRTPPPRDLTMLIDEIRDYVRKAWQLAS